MVFSQVKNDKRNSKSELLQQQLLASQGCKHRIVSTHSHTRNSEKPSTPSSNTFIHSVCSCSAPVQGGARCEAGKRKSVRKSGPGMTGVTCWAWGLLCRRCGLLGSLGPESGRYVSCWVSGIAMQWSVPAVTQTHTHTHMRIFIHSWTTGFFFFPSVLQYIRSWSKNQQT